MKTRSACKMLRFALVLAGLFVAGCRLPNWPLLKSTEPDNPLTGWNGPLREPSSAGHGAALDPRARQIERNLGIR